MAKAIESPSFERHGLSDEQLRWMLRNMHLQRTLDNRGFQLNRQGKIPFATGSEGHEGIHAGASLAFERGKDILVPYYRDIGLCLGVGYDPLDVMLMMFARGEDRSGGRQFPNHFTNRARGIMSISSIIAGHVSHAVGAAYGMKFRKETGRAVLCGFGDGATSEGEWHESVNFAAIHDLPIVLLCENNEWAISTPRSHQMACRDVTQKADGYGIPGVQVEGSDPIAVYKIVKEAMQRARSGGGPTLIEAKCYRFMAHTTDDDDRTYRTREEIERHRSQDPIPIFERFLLEHGLMTADDVTAMKKEVLALVNDITDRAEALPFPEPSQLYVNVYEGTHEPWL
jgi:2-oxoisovalerate dehydrogenase E1 component alpha subunit